MTPTLTGHESWLTDREIQILESLRQTHSVKHTAAHLSIGRRRVYNALSRIRYKKMLSRNTVNRLDAIDDSYVKKLLIPVVRKEVEDD